MAEEKFWNPGSKLNAGKEPSLEASSLGVADEVLHEKKRSSSLGHAALKISGGVAVVAVLVALLGYFFVIRPATKVLSAAGSLNRDARMASDGFVARDLVEVSAALGYLEVDLENLRQSRDENFSWAQKVGLTRPYFEDSENFIIAGERLVDAAKEAVVLVEPFADAAGLRVSEDVEVVDQSLIDAFSSWVSIMPKIAENSDGVIDQLILAGEALEGIDVARYPKKIRGIEIRGSIERAKSALATLNESAPDVKKALTLFPTLLGTDGAEVRYMIIMQNDKEIRPTGGFWTNYATFKIKNALLTSDFTSQDMYSIDLALESIDSYYDFPDAPAPYTKYLKVEHLFTRDTNTSPDFPTSVANFMEFYNMAGRVIPSEIKPVSGVIAIDTNVLAELMDVTGPVTVNGITYTSDNVVLELEKLASLTLAEQSGRKRVLGYLMQAMLVNVFESESSLWPQLVEKVIDLAVRKHVLVNLDSVEAQELVEKYGLGGTITDPVEGDYAYVVSTNLGGDKTNWFVEKDVTHMLEEVEGRWMKTVTIDYSYPQPSAEYAPFVKRFRDWVRVYVPLGSELVSAEGIEDSFGGGSEKGKDYFDGFLTLGPDETKTVTFKYYLPDGVVVSGDPYKLLIQKQPGIISETHTIQVPGASAEIELTKDYNYQITL